MSGRPKQQHRVLAHRDEVAQDGEPLFTTTRSVGRRSGSLDHTIPSEARDLLGLAKDDQVQIEIYPDGYFVTVVSDGDE